MKKKAVFLSANVRVISSLAGIMADWGEIVKKKADSGLRPRNDGF